MPKNEATVKSKTIVKLFDKIYHLASNFESDFKIGFTARQNAEFQSENSISRRKHLRKFSILFWKNSINSVRFPELIEVVGYTGIIIR